MDGSDVTVSKDLTAGDWLQPVEVKFTYTKYKTIQAIIEPLGANMQLAGIFVLGYSKCRLKKCEKSEC